MECATLDRLLDAARSGESGVLVVRGEPGIGKTALLEYAIDSAPDMRLLRAAGVQSEIELAFAGLHQLCAPLLDRLDRLPDPQQQAVSVAFGMSGGEAPDRFVVGLAALSLLSDAAEEQPLMCVVDDAQSLDEESALALAFVARRLFAESVAMVLVTRKTSEGFDGLPELEVRGLNADDARSLLSSAIPGLVDEQVRGRILAETNGNPLALLELPRGLSAADLAGGFGVPDDLPLADRIEQSFVRRLGSLPAETRQLLLTAAAEPVGDVTLLWRAAERLELGADAAEPAQTAGLIDFGRRVRFRHPLVRSAIYQAAAVPDRWAVHRALAEATDSAANPDRRAWHLAQAAGGPDEEVASELERSADRARARGGVAAAAGFLERAAELTPDSARRGARALAAAQAKQQAGAFDAAVELLSSARVGPLGELDLARTDLLGAQIAFVLNRGSDAPPLLLKAAKKLEPLDVELSRETYLEALSAGMFAARLATGGGLLEAAEAARAAPRAPQPPRATDLLLDGLATRFTEGYAAGAPVLKRAVDAFRGEHVSNKEALRWLWLACIAALDLWDYEAWDWLSARHVQLARDVGALSELPLALNMRSVVHTFAGELSAAGSLIEEVATVTEATGIRLTPYGAVELTAMRGREAEALELIDVTTNDAAQRGEGVGLTVAELADAWLNNGHGRYERALAAARRAAERTEELGVSLWALPEVIEAAARSARPDLAVAALERLAETTQASGTDWALGIEARSRAVLAEDEGADELYRGAIERLGRGGVGAFLARTHLIYGEWLRRERRRRDAREQLRIAHEMLTEMGMEAFAERARRELQATGETARKRSVETRDDLTPQETQIARLARDGFSNPDIGAQLFISPRTVQYHLHKVFTKLDITSRNQLGGVAAGRLDSA